MEPYLNIKQYSNYILAKQRDNMTFLHTDPVFLSYHGNSAEQTEFRFKYHSMQMNIMDPDTTVSAPTRISFRMFTYTCMYNRVQRF